MARRAARAEASQYNARTVADDFSARDTGDELEPMYAETPSGSNADLEDTPAPAAGAARGGRMSSQIAALPPVTRALFTYLARLARSLTEGAPPESRPIPPEQRSKGVLLVVQVLPDGRRVVFR